MAEDITVKRFFPFKNGQCFLSRPTNTQEENELWKFLRLAHTCEQCGERYYWVNIVTPMSILCENVHEHYASKTRTVKIELRTTDTQVEAKEVEQ